MGTYPCVVSAAATAISCDDVTSPARFVIAGTPRSGSHWLVSALNAHPDIACTKDEILDDPYLKDHPDFAADPWAGIQALWQRGCAARKTAGFKVFYFHCWDYYHEHRPIWSRLGADEGLRVLFLTRANLLELALSWMKARLTHQWSIKDAAARIEVPPVEVDAAELSRMFDHIEAGVARMEAFFCTQAQLRVTYEDLFDDTASRLNEIQDFLGVARRPLTGRFAKQETRPPHEAIRNFDALQRTFSGTRYAGFFEWHS